jgi:cell division protein FtsN
MARNTDSTLSRNSHSTAQAARRGNARPIMLGILIGLFVGVAMAASVAVYVAFYVKHVPMPFSQKPATTPELRQKAEVANSGTQNPAPVDVSHSAGEDKSADNPRFTFYEDLPKGNQGASSGQNGKDAKTKAGANEAATTDAEAQAKVQDKAIAQDKAAKDAVYYVQAGAYSNQEEADNQKAKLALMGLEARVRAADTTDKGRVHRVRLGPFNEQEEVDEVLQNLKENGITATVIKLSKNQVAPKAQTSPPTASTN